MYADQLGPVVSGRCVLHSVSSLDGRQPQTSTVFPLAILSSDCMVITVSMRYEKADFGRRIEREKGKNCEGGWLSSLMNVSDVFKQMDYHHCTHSAESRLLRNTFQSVVAG